LCPVIIALGKMILYKERALGGTVATVTFLLLRFGNAAQTIADLIAQNPDLAQRLVPHLPFCRVEITYSLRHEMVVHLEDLLRRRIPLTSSPAPTRSWWKPSQPLPPPNSTGPLSTNRPRFSMLWVNSGMPDGCLIGKVGFGRLGC
jgi:hypothetical protein